MTGNRLPPGSPPSHSAEAGINNKQSLLGEPIRVSSPSSARIALILAALAVIAFAWSSGLSSLAEQQINAGIQRAFVSFGTARALNATIAVLQGTAVSVQPFGVGMNLTVGQVLEPVNRVVEQFSNAMLFASVAFGIERVLLAVGSWWPVSAGLTISTLACCRSWWFGCAPHRLTSQALALLLVLRFAVPIVTVGSDFVFHQFLRATYAESTRGLNDSRAKVQRAAPDAARSQASKGLMDKIKEAAAAPVEEVKQRYEGIRSAAEAAIENMVHLLVIFMLQTVVIPLILLWALFRAARLLIDTPSVPWTSRAL